jgi:hypothetical protein|nr:MAG TPA: hypothetical protein [Caudoviricetes sp.]
MKPFDYKEALEGKICKAANNMHILLLADANADARINPKPVEPLVGLVFDNDWLCFLRYWNYEGKSSLPEERIDIIGILDEDESEQLKNMPILIRAAKKGLKVQWDSNEYGENLVWDVKKMYFRDTFLLSCGDSSLETDGSNLSNLRIVEE